MSGPCLCGATDCPRCFPGATPFCRRCGCDEEHCECSPDDLDDDPCAGEAGWCDDCAEPEEPTP